MKNPDRINKEREDRQAGKPGRPKGTGEHQILRERLIKKYGITPLEYMMKLLADDKKRPSKLSQEKHDEKRMWAAEKAAPYMHPKLNAVELSSDDEGDEVDGLKIVFVKAKVSKK